MLITVQRLNWEAQYAYAPPREAMLVNTDHIVTAKETEARGSGPFVLLTMLTGEKVTVCGRPEDFLPKPCTPPIDLLCPFCNAQLRVQHLNAEATPR